jgi:phenylpropionate dioxygenase-like ring-hydroxylating dioxygenase large terminal subunit
MPRAGEFLTTDIGAERALIVRDSSGTVHALRNSCPESPHVLVANRSGRFDAEIECKVHGLAFSLDGRCRSGARRAGLGALELSSVGGLMFARSKGGKGSADALRSLDAARSPRIWLDEDPPSALMSLSPPAEFSIAADWKVVVEQWLESSQDLTSSSAEDSLVWRTAALNDSTWSGRLYRRIVECVAPLAWRRQFIAPNQLLETRPDGLSVVQALPASPGRCLVRRLDYTVLAPEESARAALYLARRLGPYTRRSMLDVAESIQEGIVDFGYDMASGGVGSPAVAWFRQRLAALVPALARPRPPGTWYTHPPRTTDGRIV